MAVKLRGKLNKLPKFLRRKLKTWPKIQQRIDSYISGMSNSTQAVSRFSSIFGFKRKPLFHARTEITDREIKIIVSLKKGTLTFWVRPKFDEEKLVKLTIESKKNIAPFHILNDLIFPMTKMLKEETDVYIEQKITHR